MAGFGLSGLIKVIYEDWIAHNRDWTRAGFKAIAVYRFGIWRMTLKRGAIRGILGYVYRFLYRRSCWKWGIEIPYGARIGHRVIFHHQGPVVINGYCAIGDDCVIRHGVTMGLRYGPDDCPTVGNRVEIGVGAVILGRISVGDDSIVGANAVVLRDVPPDSVAVGVPAKIYPRKPASGAPN